MWARFRKDGSSNEFRVPEDRITRDNGLGDMGFCGILGGVFIAVFCLSISCDDGLGSVLFCGIFILIVDLVVEKNCDLQEADN